MRLREYMKKEGLTISGFARKYFYSRPWVSGLMNGRIKPCKGTAERISQLTGGAVTAQEILDEYKGAAYVKKHVCRPPRETPPQS